jgi:hypothetical protein
MFNFFKTKKVCEKVTKVREVREIPNFSERNNYLENKRLEFENKPIKTNKQLKSEIDINVCKKVDELLIFLNKTDNNKEDELSMLKLCKEIESLLKPDAENDICQQTLVGIGNMSNCGSFIPKDSLSKSILLSMCTRYNYRINNILFKWSF